MGRIAGVTAAETRQRLLDAAAEVFAAKGYAGTRVADIAGRAGLSNGALYAHFDSKAALLAEALRNHGSTQLASLFLDNPDRTLLDLLVVLGSSLPDHPPEHGALVVEAIVAARRDPELARLMTEHVGERDAWLVDLIGTAQADGVLDPVWSPETISRFSVMLLFGSLLVAALDLPEVDRPEWQSLIARVAGSLQPDRNDAGPTPTGPLPTGTTTATRGAAS